MKKSLLLAGTMALFSTSAALADEVIDLTFDASQYHQVYFASDGDWYTTINLGDYEFYFDIFGPAEGLVSGQAYTLADMITDYSFLIDYTNVKQVLYVSASYTETATGNGSKTIEAQVVGDNGITYNLTGVSTPSEASVLTMPEGLETIPCVLSCVDYDYGEETFEAALAFDGSDVYLEGCGYVADYFGATIKGTVSGNTLTFPAAQCVGIGSTNDFYLYGFDLESFALLDVVFNYDEELAAYVAASDLVVTPEVTSTLSSYYEWISSVVLTPSTPVAIQQVTAEQTQPAKRLEQGRLIIKANGMDFDGLGARIK